MRRAADSYRYRMLDLATAAVRIPILDASVGWGSTGPTGFRRPPATG